jgi:hypothetical protein
MPCEVVLLRVGIFMETAKMLKKKEKKMKNTKMIIAGYSPKKSESVGQTLLQLPWKQKRGDLK